jgi:hypothetical protein
MAKVNSAKETKTGRDHGRKGGGERGGVGGGDETRIGAGSRPAGAAEEQAVHGQAHENRDDLE